MKTLNKSMRKQRGFSLTEMALTLVILAILGNMAYSKYQESREETKADGEQADISSIIGNVQNKFATSPDYSTATLQVLISNGVFPASLTNLQTNTVTNRYGGSVTMAVTQNVNPADSLTFTSTNYTLAGCQSVVPKITSNVLTLSVNGTVVQPVNGTLDRAALGNACSSNSTITYMVAK